MNPQVLASISRNRHIAHEAGQIVHLNWDSQQFSLARPGFVQFVRTLETGYRRDFAEADDEAYSVVQVDDDVRDVWIENTCLSVNRSEYRALLEAALRTETRLHGFRVTNTERDYRRFTMYRLPRPTHPDWN